MMWSVQTQRPSGIEKIGIVQTRGVIVQINYVVRNRTLGAELPENQIAHPEVFPSDPHLSAGRLLFPLNLAAELRWAAQSIWRISEPEVARFRCIQSDIHLRRL